jgi:hypothetical protein
MSAQFQNLTRQQQVPRALAVFDRRQEGDQLEFVRLARGKGWAAIPPLTAELKKVTLNREAKY